MSNITVLKHFYAHFAAVFLIVIFSISTFAYFNPSEAMVQNTLDKNTCNYRIENLVGRYSIKVGGLGMIDDISGNTYSGSFNITGVNGTPRNVFLYWTLKKATNDNNLQLKVNNAAFRNVTANQTFGPAVLRDADTTYWGYIADLGSANINVNGTNTFTIQNATNGDPTMEFFGVGVLIIHHDPSLANDQHIEVKCGFDGTYMSHIGDFANVTKWGEWSNVVCHEFPADNNDIRSVKYYAFMSGTKKKTTSPVMYRPNAFWYRTGQGSPQSIYNLNKGPGMANDGLSSIQNSKTKNVNDLFDAISGNEWDTIDTASNIPDTLKIQIPADDTYICFQTQSRNVLPNTVSNGRGSSMQWSMSALSFAYSGTATSPVPTPTPPPGASPTPVVPSQTPTPTPIIFRPWVNTLKGNTYSQRFNQTPLTNFNISNSFIDPSNFAGFNGEPAYLSTHLYLQPIGGSTPPRSSKTNSQLGGYTDSNSEYKTGISWFSYFDQYLKNTRTDITKTPITFPIVAEQRTSVIHPTGDLSQTAIYTSGNLSIDIDICDSKSIFLIDGNLSLNPNLKVEGNENGCMFIVKGNTTILKGADGGSADPNKTVYDQVHGYFITGLFSTAFDEATDGLHIKGGVVETDTSSGNMSLNRNLGPLRSQFSPSEIFEYDPRYLYIYGDLLTYLYGYNIREGQFIRSL